MTSSNVSSNSLAKQPGQNVHVVTPSGLGRRILNILRLEPGDELLLVETRDGSVLVQRPAETHSEPNEDCRSRGLLIRKAEVNQHD